MRPNTTSITELILQEKDPIALSAVFLDEISRQQLVQLVREYRYAEELCRYGLPVNNKVLLHGHSGCGKTMTAKAMANALGKKILILNLSTVVGARIGETAQNLKLVFDKASREEAVLFLDEFDQIGKARGNDDKDVGEMRRLVNTLLQLIDYYPEKALLLCATNHPELIDTALLRRFQLRIQFELPTQSLLDTYYTQLLSRFPTNLQFIERKYGISFAEARDHAFTHVKAALIDEWEATQKSVER